MSIAILPLVSYTVQTERSILNLQLGRVKRNRYLSLIENDIRGSSFILFMLTHRLCVANGEKTCSILQQFSGRNCVTLIAAVS